RLETIDVKWIYKLKLRPNGEIAKYKARLVARGFLQKAGIDFNEVYAPVARLETIRIVVTIAAYNGWKMHQLLRCEVKWTIGGRGLCKASSHQDLRSKVKNRRCQNMEYV
ncbi:putative copia-type polyprotein, partial [Trifolium pratense]